MSLTQTANAGCLPNASQHKLTLLPILIKQLDDVVSKNVYLTEGLIIYRYFGIATNALVHTEDSWLYIPSQKISCLRI